jgi:2-polyprenyl-3-methyl-5-hydroxy-6-metoxy-1,4-benzoquinol methylase
MSSLLERNVPTVTSGQAALAPCPLCGSASRFKFMKHGNRYYHCRCGFEFIWPRPASAELEAMYQRDGEEYWSHDDMIEFAFSNTKSTREIGFLQRFASGGSLLDIGCSTGSFVKAAMEAGFAASGVDISGESVKIGRRFGLPLSVCDIFHASPGEQQFDIVTMWATLEHLPDPVTAVHRAGELLKQNGLLIVSVPNLHSLTHRTLRSWYRYVCDEHLNYFAPRVLRTMMAKMGFRCLGTMTYGFNPLMIVGDVVSRGREPVACSQMRTDEARTLRLKRSPLRYAQQFSERVLNLVGAADVLALAARRVALPRAAGLVSEGAQV